MLLNTGRAIGRICFDNCELVWHCWLGQRGSLMMTVCLWSRDCVLLKATESDRQQVILQVEITTMYICSLEFSNVKLSFNIIQLHLMNYNFHISYLIIITVNQWDLKVLKCFLKHKYLYTKYKIKNTNSKTMCLCLLLYPWSCPLSLCILTPPPSIPTGPVSPEWCNPQTGVHNKGVSRERPLGQRLPAGPL